MATTCHMRRLPLRRTQRQFSMKRCPRRCPRREPSVSLIWKSYNVVIVAFAAAVAAASAAAVTDVLSLLLWTWLLLTVAKAGVIRDFGEDTLCRSYTLSGRLRVDCSNLGLSELPAGLNYDAQVLDLSNNNFMTFPTGLEKFTSLEKLDMSGNHLNDPLPIYMTTWNDIITLNLSNNNYGVWISTGKQYSIRRLDLSKNKISNIDDTSFNEMPLLYFLDLSENRIYDLPPRIFAEMKNLDSLILSRNYFSAIPTFQSSSLTNLHMSSCQIPNLNKDSLIGMSALLQINLSLNQIESIPDNFEGNTLQELDLSYNGISTLTDESFSSLPHLAVLDLRGNDFREVWSTSYFSSNPFLRKIYVKGNRWSCEGFGVNLFLTYEFLTKEPAKIEDTSSLICYSPANVTQLTWQQAYIRTWHPAETTMSYTTIAVMIGVVIGIILTSIVCRGLMAINSSNEPLRLPTETTVLNGNGNSTPIVESTVIRVPLREDLPPSYDEALLMPRLNSSFHSLPDFVEEDEEEITTNTYRRSRSIGDLTEHRPRTRDRRSMRRTVEIHINNC